MLEIMEHADTQAILSNLTKIAKKYGIKEFIKVERGDEACKANGVDSYINSSYICGNDRIEIGIYSDVELMIVSFFHELGHIVNNKEGMFNSEKQAWKIGFKLAKQHHYYFCGNTYKWAKEQLNSYN